MYKQKMMQVLKAGTQKGSRLQEHNNEEIVKYTMTQASTVN